MTRQRKNTLMLVLVVVAVAVAALAGQQYRRMTAEPAVVAVVKVNGTEVYRLDLSKETEVTVDDGEGNYNVIAVAYESVAVIDANCGNLTCVYTGALTESDVDGVITCLPHSMVVTIE